METSRRPLRVVRGVGVILLLIGLAAPPGTAIAGLGQGSLERLVQLADPALRDAIARGDASFEVIVTRAPHSGLSEGRFASRAEAREHLERLSAPFFRDVRDVVRAAGGSVLNQWSAAPAVKIGGPLTVLQAAASIPGTIGITLDYRGAVRIEPIEDDSVNATNSEGRAMIQAEEIWDLGYRGEGIRISIVDTGFDPTHEAFKFADGSSRLLAFSDCINGTDTCNDVAAYDDHGHGTHVGGTSAGSDLYDDPTYGFFEEVGVAPRAELIASKFLDAGGGGTFGGGISALEWSYDNGADVTSNSWGGGCDASVGVIATVRELTDLGMLSVFAAGNSGPSPGSVGGPGCGESSLTVGAVDVGYNIADFSSRGPCADPDTGSGSRICPDVVAKGVAVRSSIPRSGASNSDPSGYKTWQGTSMATPHVSGAVALAEQFKVAITGSGWDTAARAEEDVFTSTALDLGALAEDDTYGWGHPQLTSIHAVLDAPPEAIIVSSISASRTTVREGESTVLRFTVRNLGGAEATGPFLAELIDPDGNVTVVKASTPTLGLLDSETGTTTFTADADTPFDTFTFHGTWDYSWVDIDGNPQVGSVDKTVEFSVVKPVIEVSIAGLDPLTPPGKPQLVTVTVANTGNDIALNSIIDFKSEGYYQYLPGTNYDPAKGRSRYTNPTPYAVIDPVFNGTTWVILLGGTIGPGGSFSFTSNLVPTTIGDHDFLINVRFKDGANRPLVKQGTFTQTVLVPV